MDCFLGEIHMFGGTFAPMGWVFCDGSLLDIGQNSALFTLLGTTYGGDGITTFAVPDLRGRLAMGCGQGPGLTSRALGDLAGAETVQLTSGQMPAHTHLAAAYDGPANADGPAGSVLAQGQNLNQNSPVATYGTGATGLAYLAPNSLGSVGVGQPFAILQPTLNVNYIIATEGIYPSFN